MERIDDELYEIHLATLEVLERTGVQIKHSRALEILTGAGARVDGDRVRMPAWMVEEAIRQAPSRVVLGRRNGERSVHLEGDKVWFGLHLGGALCPACHNQDLHPMEMSRAALELMRKFESISMARLRETYSADEFSREASDMLYAFVRTEISEGSTIRSLDFLERMRNSSLA